MRTGSWTGPPPGGRASRGCLLLLLLYSRTGPRRALSLKLSDTRIYEPEKNEPVSVEIESYSLAALPPRGEPVQDNVSPCSEDIRLLHTLHKPLRFHCTPPHLRVKLIVPRDTCPKCRVELGPLPCGMIRFWVGYHESRGCSRDTYPEAHITKHASIRGQKRQECWELGPLPGGLSSYSSIPGDMRLWVGVP